VVVGKLQMTILNLPMAYKLPRSRCFFIHLNPRFYHHPSMGHSLRHGFCGATWNWAGSC